MYTASNKIEDELWKISLWEDVIIVCDDWVNCFDAKLIWAELENGGVTFLWRFTNPDYLIQK